jgi:hypothetical protein
MGHGVVPAAPCGREQGARDGQDVHNTEAALWFATAHLLRETDKTRWDQVGAQDVQRWTVRLLATYSDAYP